MRKTLTCIFILFFTTSLWAQLQMKPDHVRIDKVKKLINKGKPDKALKRLQAYFPDFKDDPDLYYIKGLAYQELDSLDLAIENYLISLVIFEHYNDALFNLGAIHYNKAVDLIKTDKDNREIVSELQLAQGYLERLVKTETDHLSLQYLHQIYKMTDQPESRLDSLLDNQFIYAYLEDEENTIHFADSSFALNIEDHIIEAKFPGGDEAKYRFIGHNIVYPEFAKYNGIQGTVYVGFVVEADGSLSNLRILKGVEESLNREALIVLMKMPKWKPAKNSQGQAVRCGIQIPIKFTLM